ncbi:hypothetical protein [Gloeobacter violaceus]|uniref:Gll2269 protein n=1 Tax=Gloeobacter violaceus (strain ATCC 29082 / PCC 7421) TaxID=251221 RepID=Q7NIB4_GLOVI|nr:hypothetical protein [Gloeobacter violaceus]BAC90210.1 gll2269 [Gloeobacter violaceus PCC 7421]
MPPQLFLDPRDRTTAGVYHFGGPIPLRVRRFGLYANIGNWLPGDLVLVSPLQPDFTQSLIIAGHTDGGYQQKDARWHHAAIYVGDGDICEAMPVGVRHTSMDIYIDGRHFIRVRRDLDLEMDQRWRIALRALTKLKTPYSIASIFDLFWLSRVGFNSVSNAVRPKRGAYICSQLYADAYSPITGKVLQNPRSGEITPAFLSSTDQLQDVPVHWLQLEA